MMATCRGAKSVKSAQSRFGLVPPRNTLSVLFESDRMKKCIFLFVSTVWLTLVDVRAQTTVAGWTFETGSLSGASGTSPVGIGGFLSANVGTGTATALHASSSSLWFKPAGNGSSGAFAGTTWGVGDYFQFSTSTTGYSSISVTWDQYSYEFGPRDFGVSYSVDGTNFTSAGSFVVSDVPAWNPTTPQTGSATNFSIDLSGVSALANASTVYFRLITTSATAVNGGAIGTFAYSVLDNFTVTGTAIPEPAAYALWFAAFAFAGISGWKRWRGQSGA